MTGAPKKGMVVLPVLLEDVELPALLADKRHADLRAVYGRDAAVAETEGFRDLLSVLKMEGPAPKVRDGQFVAAPEVTGGPFEQCVELLRQLSDADLRRRLTQVLSRAKFALTWHAVFGERLDDVLPREPLPNCIMEAILRAREEGRHEELIDEVCRDYADAVCRALRP